VDLILVTVLAFLYSADWLEKTTNRPVTRNAAITAVESYPVLHCDGKCTGTTRVHTDTFSRCAWAYFSLRLRKGLFKRFTRRCLHKTAVTNFSRD